MFKVSDTNLFTESKKECIYFMIGLVKIRLKSTVMKLFYLYLIERE